jgi:AraC-like DNA-binding protein
MKLNTRDTGGIRFASGETSTGEWAVAHRALPAALAPYVRDMSGYSERSAAPIVRRELPGVQIVVIFEFGPPIAVYASGSTDRAASGRFASGFVAGLDERFTLTEHAGRQAGLQLNLTPRGARLFFDVPLSEIRGRTVEFADLVPEARTFSQRLAEAPDWATRFNLVEALLLRRIADAKLEFSGLAWALEQIHNSESMPETRALAHALGYSQKRLIGLFHDRVGLTPRAYGALLRFDRWTQRLRTASPLDWSALAQDCGYYDQSHMVREVRRFTGLTPVAARQVVLGAGEFQTPG